MGPTCAVDLWKSCKEDDVSMWSGRFGLARLR